MSIEKAYIATTLSNVEAFETMRDELSRMRVELTFDWHAAGPVERNLRALKQRAQDDMDGVIYADKVFVILPGGKGTHTELGAAICMAVANNVEVFLISERLLETDPEDGYPCVFHFHPAVTRKVLSVSEYRGFVEELYAGVTPVCECGGDCYNDVLDEPLD